MVPLAYLLAFTILGESLAFCPLLPNPHDLHGSERCDALRGGAWAGGRGSRGGGRVSPALWPAASFSRRREGVLPEGRLDPRNHNLVGLGMTSSGREADVGDGGEERGKGSAQEQLAVGGSVYMVATPIGNMQDMTSRAISILGSADYVVSEDTRRTGILLKHFGISAKQMSHHEHNWAQKAPEIVDMAKSGMSFAVVSDAGTPGISDPGMQLAQMCHDAGIPVRPVPGACAAAAGISVSGMGSGEFLFKGFLPAKGKERKEAIERVCSCDCAVVLYESPHRIVDTLKDIAKMQGDRGVLVGRELTKIHEETFRGTVDQAVAHLGGPGGETRGEFTLVLQETAKVGKGGDDAGDMAAIEMMQLLIDEGVKTSIAGKAVASALGLPKNKAKKLALGLSSKGKSRGGVKEEEEEEEEEESVSSFGFKVVGLDHIVLRARDPKALESFYTRVLGCSLVKRNDKAKMSHLSMGASLLDIIGYADGDVKASSTSTTSNMDHFCVSVSPFDPDSITKHLKANGLEPSPPKMRFGARGDGLSIYFEDCEGNTVEIKGTSES